MRLWVLIEEGLHQFGFVSREVVQNNVEFLFRWAAGDDFA